MEKVIHVAVDLETLSLQPDAAIISIAAVPFDPEKSKIFIRDKCFYEAVNATTCAFFGMRFDMDTVEWWADRSEEAKAELLNMRWLSIGDAMHSFHSYLEEQKEKHNAELRIWAQGSDFDIPVLRNAYAKVLPGMELPWKYTGVRDVRTYVLETLEKIYGPEENPYDRIPDMPGGEDWLRHSALSDAMRTAWNVSWCYFKWRNFRGQNSSDTTRK